MHTLGERAVSTAQRSWAEEDASSSTVHENWRISEHSAWSGHYTVQLQHGLAHLIDFHCLRSIP